MWWVFINVILDYRVKAIELFLSYLEYPLSNGKYKLKDIVLRTQITDKWKGKENSYWLDIV